MPATASSPVSSVARGTVSNGVALPQRSHGSAAVALSTPGGRARLSRLAQSGSAKAFLPRVYDRDPEIVFLNTSGGLTGGDSLCYAVDLADGGRATATTQTAERAYASAGGVARVSVRLRAGAGAVLHWLPQETILFDQAALHRDTAIDLDPGATCVLLETVVLGRTAMGEDLADLDLVDRRQVRVAGRPVLLDPLHLDGASLASRSAPAVLDGAVALATLAVIGPTADAGLARLRGALHALPRTVTAAASAWDGKLVLRALARDAFDLRRGLAGCLGALPGVRVPVVWGV